MSTAPRATVESEIRQRIDRLVEAIRAMDIERVMAIYAPDIISFDIEPPLQHVGAEAKRKNWLNALSMYQRPLSYESATSRSPWAKTWQ